MIRICARAIWLWRWRTRSAAAIRRWAILSRFRRTMWAIEPPPLLGEHSGELLGSLLGLDDAAIGRLRGDGVV